MARLAFALSACSLVAAADAHDDLQASQARIALLEAQNKDLEKRFVDQEHQLALLEAKFGAVQEGMTRDREAMANLKQVIATNERLVDHRLTAVEAKAPSTQVVVDERAVQATSRRLQQTAPPSDGQMDPSGRKATSTAFDGPTGSVHVRERRRRRLAMDGSTSGFNFLPKLPLNDGVIQAVIWGDQSGELFFSSGSNEITLTGLLSRLTILEAAVWPSLNQTSAGISFIPNTGLDGGFTPPRIYGDNTGELFFKHSSDGVSLSGLLAAVDFVGIKLGVTKELDNLMGRGPCHTCPSDWRNYIHLFGGLNSDNTVSKRVDRYNPFTSAWEARADMQVARANFAAVQGGSYFYVLGGLTTKGNLESQVASVERYDPALNSWQDMAPMQSARKWFCAAFLGDRIYVIGGAKVGGSWSRKAEKYSVASNTWSYIDDYPWVAVGVACAVLNGELYVAGGEENNAVMQRHVYRMDSPNGAWTNAHVHADMGHLRSNFALVPLHGFLYAIAGGSKGDDGVRTDNTVEKYDPASNTWVYATSTNTEIYGQDYATTDGTYLYTVGSVAPWIGASLHGTSQRYDPATNLWAYVDSMKLPGRSDSEAYFKAAVASFFDSY